MMVAAPLLSARNLSVGILRPNSKPLAILRDVSLDLASGETLGIVGESGCGKSTLLDALTGLLKPGVSVLAGQVHFKNIDVLNSPPQVLESLRGGKIGFVPQNASVSLTPTLRIYQHLAEQMTLKTALPPDRHEARMLELLEAVRIPRARDILKRYPHELSGGQQQRVAIALALAGDPEVLLLDEPTTALDVTTKSMILTMLREIAEARRLSMIYVSHDLGVIAHVSHHVVVMYAGEVVERGPVRQVLKAPKHPYTQGLIASVPRIATQHLPRPMPGALPPLSVERRACAFAPRCPIADSRCTSEMPPSISLGDDWDTRCFKPDAPKSVLVASEVPSSRAQPSDQVVFRLANVTISYSRQGFLAKLFGRALPRPVVPALSLTLKAGEILSLVGESGSGKSTVLRAIAGLWPPRGGSMTLTGSGALPGAVSRRPLKLLRRLQLIFQNPDDSLNPRRTVAEILARPLRLYQKPDDVPQDKRMTDVLKSVRLEPIHGTRFPAQLSGGEKQRVAIARALAADPELLLCDEITSALDVSVQAAVLDLILEVKQRSGKAMIFVSHDLAVVKQISDRVAILFRGEICEIGQVDDIFLRPRHPYTKMLLDACLEADPDVAIKPLPSESSEPLAVDRGCAFASRCPARIVNVCDRTPPEWYQLNSGHHSRCHLEAGHEHLSS